MVQNIAPELIDRQQLNQALGLVLFDADFDLCLKQIEVQKPKAGRQFWQTTDDFNPGIYIVVEGKVRIIDRHKELIVTLESGASFGESTLFPEEFFQPYSARASIGVKLYYLPEELLRSLSQRYTLVEEHLYNRAILQDWPLLCPQIADLRKNSRFIAVLSLLERHELRPGQIPFALKNKKLWLIRQGELRHSSGHHLTAGSIFALSQKERAWQVIQPTQLYSLDSTQWEKALSYLPQLEQLILSDTSPVSNGSGKSLLRADGQGKNFGATKEKSKNRLALVPKSPISEPTVTRKDGKKISKAYFPSTTLQVGHLWQRITRRYPFFQQQSASDCGAACLVMMGRYWGKRFSISRVRETANVDRNGASLRGLVTAAESIGFTARPVKTNLEQLALADLPAIVHWEGKHYIVIYQVTRDRVIVVDPAIGQRSLTHEEFNTGWTGYTLLLQPTTLLKDAEESKIPVWQFLELIKPHRIVLLEIFLASILIQIFGLVTPMFTQLLLDRVVVQRSTLTLTTVGLGLIIFGLFQVALSSLRTYLIAHTANRVNVSLIVGFITHTFRLPLNYFESRYVGDIMSRIGENRKIQQFLTGETLSVLLDLLSMFVYAGLMFWYSWKLALLVLLTLPPFALIAIFATPFLRRISREIFAASNEQTKYLIQSLTGIRTVKSLSVEQTVRWHWEELFSTSVNKAFSGQIIGNALSTVSSTLQTLISTALLWFGAWQVIQDELTIGQLVAFNMLQGNVTSPFKRLIYVWHDLQEIIISMERINDVIDAEPEEDLQNNKVRQTLPPINGHIKYEQVTFRYNLESDTNTLENISFEVYPGQTVALVGRSGSGKTTISKMLLGFYPPTEGRILIDGYDLANISLHSLRQQVGVVDQDTFLFGGTIRENISIAHPEASTEEVAEAAKQAGAHEFIKELPMGYETQIGEAGGTLSGGQKQRLAIARALLGNPQLLILDEATSSLDAESERIIQANFDAILNKRTTLVIAHRLSTVRNADLILVLDKGILVESGTHDELMAKHGRYFYLNQKQLTISD